MANVEFGTGKTVLILTIVAACFAVLWPKIFYPMIVGPPAAKRPVDPSSGCCDVWFESDVDAIRVMAEMCGRALARPGADPKLAEAFRQGKPTPAAVNACRAEVLQQCDTDIAEFLQEKARLGQSYRQILDEIRTFNTSVCLQRNFGVSLRALGAPRRMRIWGPTTSRHLRQERPPHLRPEMQHPALRERGRAIPASHIVPKTVPEKEPGPRPPIPGMRPPMGGAGHVVPAPKTGGTMSIVMPLYTIGIVIFFMYTIMKVFVRKSSGDPGLRDFESDPEFRRVVYTDDSEETRIPKEIAPTVYKTPSDDTTRLGWKERDTRDIEIDHLRRRLEETERAMERIVAQMGSLPGAIQQTAKLKSSFQVEEKAPGDLCTGVKEEEEKDSKQDVIDDSVQKVDAKNKEGYEDKNDDMEHLEEETTNYTTATMSQDAAEAEDTAADLSVLDIIDDQEDLQDEYDAIWGNLEQDDNEGGGAQNQQER